MPKLDGVQQPDPDDQPDQPAQHDPCPYPEHRDRDWTSTSGIRTCGVCHPPATPDVVAQDAPGTTEDTMTEPDRSHDEPQAIVRPPDA